MPRRTIVVVESVLRTSGYGIIPVNMDSHHHQDQDHDENHGHNHHGHQFTPLANLRQPMPFWRKMELVVSNNLAKIRTRQGCCGNLGQPGC